MTSWEALYLFPAPMQQAITAVLELEAQGAERADAIAQASSHTGYSASEVAHAYRMYRQHAEKEKKE